MDLMEFLIALRDTAGTEWSDDDTARWIKELFCLQAKLEVAEEDVARVEQNYKNRCEITEQHEAQLLDLRGENEKLKDVLRWFQNNVCRNNFWINSEPQAEKLRDRIDQALSLLKQPEPSEFTSKIYKDWYNDQGESPGRYLYYSD